MKDPAMLDGPPFKCRFCPKTSPSSSYIGEHMRKAHGVWGGVTGKIRKDQRGSAGRRAGRARKVQVPARRTAPPPIPLEAEPDTDRFTDPDPARPTSLTFLDQFRLGVDDEGNFYICERWIR